MKERKEERQKKYKGFYEKGKEKLTKAGFNFDVFSKQFDLKGIDKFEKMNPKIALNIIAYGDDLLRIDLL